jgi:hypothetical protein
MNETQGLVASLLLVVVVFVYTFWPDNSLLGQKQKSRLEYLDERKEQVYENLRDLNFEFKAGKYPEEDFVVQRGLLEQEAADLLAEMDQLQKAQA